jgi:tetratricopeptide (TPR) repeat protein
VLEGKANAFIRQEQFVEAKELLLSAIDLFGARVPPSTWGNLGFTLNKLEQFDEALVAHRKCVAAHEAVNGIDHPRTLRKLGDLSYALFGLGCVDEAESVLQRMVDGFAAQPDREPLWHAQALLELGHFYLRARRDPTAALEYFDRVEKLRDACSLRYPSGKVIRDGFPARFEADLVGNRVEAVAALGRTEEAAQLRARWELIAEHARTADRLLREG